MHRPATFRPACWTDTATERQGWSRDRGAMCGNASDPDDVKRLLNLTPTCQGCARLTRGLAIFMGVVDVLTPDVRGTKRSIAA